MKVHVKSMMKSLLLLFGATAWLAVGAQAQQPPSDLSGAWDFGTTLSVLVAQAAPCQYEGTANILQSGVDLKGNASMMLVSGDAFCPSEASADLVGAVNGPAVTLTLDGGSLGQALLAGEFVGGLTYTGSIAVEGGPFASSSGSWSAARGRRESIPTLGFVGATVLTLLLASAALVMLRARSNA